MTYKETLLFIGKSLTINHEKHNKIIIENQLKSNTIDWDSVVKISTGHFIFPALYCNLKKADFLHYLPKDLVEYMKHIADLNRERNQQIIAQAKEINELLLANNITPIFLKGTGNLLEGLYDDIAERMVGDIDFLVPEKDFFPTIKLMKDNQYKKTKDNLTNPFFVKHYPRIFHNDKIAAVEIHNNMIKGRKVSSFNYKSIINHLMNKGKISLLNYNNQITLTILASQLNDNGSVYKKLTLRNTYDLYLMIQKADKPYQFNKAFFNILNNYLFVSSYYLNSKKIAFKKTLKSKIYLKLTFLKFDFPFFGKLHTSFWKALIYINIKFASLIRFIKHKEFRKYYIKKLIS